MGNGPHQQLLLGSVTPRPEGEAQAGLDRSPGGNKELTSCCLKKLRLENPHLPSWLQKAISDLQPMPCGNRHVGPSTSEQRRPHGQASPRKSRAATPPRCLELQFLSSHLEFPTKPLSLQVHMGGGSQGAVRCVTSLSLPLAQVTCSAHAASAPRRALPSASLVSSSAPAAFLPQEAAATCSPRPGCSGVSKHRSHPVSVLCFRNILQTRTATLPVHLAEGLLRMTACSGVGLVTCEPQNFREPIRSPKCPLKADF